MARKKEQKPEDPWSGFVDVLSNVVMVITFIVIILCIAMLVMSQAIAENMAKQIVESQLAAADCAAVDNASVMVNLSGRDTSSGAESGQAPEESEKQVEQDSVSESESLSAGEFRVTKGRPQLQKDETEGETELTIRSRPQDQEDVDSAISEARADPEQTGVFEVTSEALVAITYAENSYKLTDEGAEQVKTALAEANLPAGTKVEIRAITTPGKGSISGARRVGFYRALAIRNVLIAGGLKAEDIESYIRESGALEDENKVFVFVK